MTKDELENNLKNYKKNISSKELKERRLNKLSSQLDKLKNKTPEAPVSSAPGINNDIRSKNKVSKKVENAVVNKITEVEEVENEIFDLKIEIQELDDNVEDVRIRLKALNYRENKFIEERYFNGRSFKEIGNIVYFDLYKQTRSERTIKKEIESIVEKMAKI